MLHRIQKILVLCAVVLFGGLLGTPWAQAQTQAMPSGKALPPGMVAVQSVEGITAYRLDNGLQLLLIPDDAKPTTTVNMTYRVGSRHENYGETGMAHLLEHLLFKGSQKHREVWSEFTRRGLAANGSTWFDRTNYFASFSANEANLRWYLGWQADAMVNSFIARRDLDTEMTVVRNEMEMGENSPERMLFEKTLATMYQWHNYGKSTIGARSDVENVDIPRLQAFYRHHYQPDNATLIVAGKFDAAKVLQWVAQDFGPIPRPTRVLAQQYTVEPVQDGERSLTLRRTGGVPSLHAAYHVPAAAHPDFAALQVLNLVLGDTPSGRLHKQLTERQLAASTYAFAEGLAQPGFTLYGAQLAPGQAVDAAREALLSTLESLAQSPVTEDEFKRAQIKWLNAWEQAFTNPETVGVSLSESVAQGDWRLFFLLRDRVRASTRADVQAVAERYLRAANRTLGSYVPTDSPQRAPSLTAPDVPAELKAFKPQAAAAPVAAFDASPRHIEQRTQRFELGGVKVALLPKPSRGGSVTATLTLHFGNEKNLFGQNDVPEMVAALIDKGTATLNRQQVQDRLDALKTELSVGDIPGGVALTLRTRREHLPQAIALAAEMLRQPALPADALEEVRRQALAGIEAQRREPEAMAANLLSRHGNPYARGDVRHARSFDEMVQDVNSVSLAQVRAFHRRFYGAARAEFSAVGDLDVPAVRGALQAGFADWRAGEPYTRIAQPWVATPAARLTLQTPDKQNATLMAQLSLSLSDTDADYPALMMANHLLGGGGHARLWKRIREAEGLSYDVRTTISWSSHERHSVWQASAIFAPQNRAKVEAALNEELARALKEGFSAKELTEGKNGLLALRRLSRAQDGNLAAALGRNLDLGRSFEVSAQVDEALAQLTVAQVNAALRRHLQPDQFVWVWAGDFKP